MTENIQQVFIVFGLCLVGTALSGLLPLPVPGSVISMVLVLVLLLAGWLKQEKIRSITELLKKNMVFFFIPAGVGLIAELDTLRANWLPLLAICLVCTLFTFFCTAGAVWLAQWVLNKGAKK